MATKKQKVYTFAKKKIKKDPEYIVKTTPQLKNIGDKENKKL